MIQQLRFESPLVLWSNVLLTLCAGLFIFYCYLSYHNVFNLMAVQRANQQIEQIRAEVTVKEGDYFSLANKVTLSLAYSLGFKETTVNTVFAPAHRRAVATAWPASQH
jgi:hypothetical protein